MQVFFRVAGLLWPPVSCPPQRASNADLDVSHWFGSALAVKQPVKWPVIWDYMTFMWRHCNGHLTGLHFWESWIWFLSHSSAGPEYIHMLLAYSPSHTVSKLSWMWLRITSRVIIPNNSGVFGRHATYCAENTRYKKELKDTFIKDNLTEDCVPEFSIYRRPIFTWIPTTLI